MRRLVELFRFLVQVQGAIVLGARVVGGAVEILVRRHGNAKPRCPTCGEELGGQIREVSCRWRHLDLMGRQAFLAAQVREGCCPRHGRRIERVPWAATRCRHTHTFDRRVASLAQVADQTATSRMFNIAWRTVGRIITRVVDALLPKDRLDGLDAIGVDETSYKRGHRYLTVVSCLASGRVVWVGEGKSAETLGQFFAQLGPERSAKVRVVAMDLSGAFQSAVRQWAPNADLVFDRFHVVQLLLKAIDEIRREECAKLGTAARRVLKNSRFALLRAPRNRTEEDHDTIARVAKGNGHLYRGYQLRVEFEDLWDCTTEAEARSFLTLWTRSVLKGRLQPLRKFARTVRDHLEGILGFFRWGRQTNAELEGMNNKVKLIIHRAYGFHNVGSLIAMIHLCCSGLVLG